MTLLFDIPAIRNPIIKGAYQKLQCPLIRVDQTGDVPDYPYVTYTITSPRIAQSQHEIDVTTALGRTRTKTVEMVFSFTAYSEKEDETMDLCMKLVEHFDRTARDDLRDIGIVVVNIGSIDNRSVFLAEHYERRQGLDVRIRVIDRLFEPAGTGTGYIEQAEITKEE